MTAPKAKTRVSITATAGKPSAKIKARMQVSITSSAGKARIRIVDYIGEWADTGSSRAIRAQVDELLAAGVKEAEVYINSGGGDVFEATEIAHELERFDTVKIAVGSVAASAATYITSCFETTAKSGSQIMVHKPSIGTRGNVDSIESDLKLLRNTTEQYRQKYAEKTGMTEAQIDELWAKGDVWMTAKEALRYGFINAIEESAPATATEEDIALLTACGAPHIPQTTPNPKSSKPSSGKMERDQLIAALGLSADATDEQIAQAVAANKAAADAAKAAAQDNQLTAQKRAAKLVAQAILDKKIDASQKETYESLAEANYEATEKAFEGMNAKPKLSAMIGKMQTDAATLQARKDWTLDDWLDKDPEGLKELKKDHPEVCAVLEKSYFGNKR